MSSEPPEPKMKTRIVYSRDFLLSFGELEHCKKLPIGFDTALLGELQELSAGVLERNKGYYNTPLGRSDGSGGYTYSSRGGNSGGRWDTRSTGSSDRDGEVPDRESLTQGRGGNQYRRNWQNSEHDGLLGSGGFPRPSGYAGQLASKDHANAHQPNRTSERYQPPRPYKAAPLSRKDIDSMNDETFGSSECSNEDRAEEERKRRASFELMRKEQHKAMQGKKNVPDILKENPSDDIISKLQTSTEKANFKAKNEKLDGSVSSYQEDTTKPSSVLSAPAARPLVPPGFANAFVDKKLQLQSPNISLELKGRNSTTEANTSTVARLGAQLEVNQSATEFAAFESKEKGISDNVAIMGPKHTLLSGGVTSSTELASSIMRGSEDWEADVMDKYSIGKEGKSKNIDPVRKDNSISILEQFFGNALSKSGSNLPTYVESHSLKTDDNMIAPSLPESSKFARWFIDEDLKPAEDRSSKSLLSMIVKNENQGPENIIHAPPLSDASVQNLSPRAPIDEFDSASKLLSFTPSAAPDGILEQYNRSDIPEAVPVMMTCEDLEQTMLAQVKSNSSSTQRNATKEHQTVVDEPVAMQKVAVDNNASHHLLSLLQKGTDNKGSSSLSFQIGSADEPESRVDANLMANGGISGSDPINKVDNAPPPGKKLTLEALFGAAFMNELHSKDAPVSIRGSTTGGPNEFAESGKTLLASSHEGYYPVEQALSFNNSKDAAVPKEPGIEYSAVPGGLNQGNTSFDKKGLEIHLPEEDNLFTMNDSLPVPNSDILPSARSSRVEGLPEKAVDDLSYRLQSLVPGDSEHIQVLGPDALGSHPRDQRLQVESQNLYHLLQGRPPMMAPRPMMDHIVNRNQQSPFDMPQSIRHDPHRSFPSNVNPLQHNLHGPGVPHMDSAAHHLMLQHMSMPGNFPPEGLPRGVLPSQPVHHMAGYRPEMGNVNNFHMHPRQPNYGEFGLMMPGPSGPEVRGNHPEALERLIQMEMSARSKQQQVHHQAMAAGPVPGGMYGYELDTKLRYR
ncbi:unnamed protein product [Urochloa humidicola]